jgi:very-short-patch-repair endonuclease/predicted transcriptional regulator of viral defense system
MRGKGATDQTIATIADAQHGVVSRAQLSMLGFSGDEVDRRMKAGRLHAIHRGVYAVGHRALKAEGRWMAAVLAAGRGAVLSHTSAAAAWDLRRTSSGLIHVTVPGDPGRKRRRGLRIHRSRTLIADDVTVHTGIPVTTPTRTIIDLARTLEDRALDHIVDLADQRGLVDFDTLRKANSASLQAVLSAYDSAPTRSEMEKRFLKLCDDHGIPRPQTNSRVEGLEVDFVWRERRLVVEVDGYRYHRSPARFEWDREKDVTLETKGWRVMRFTWRQITRRREWVAAAIR